MRIVFIGDIVGRVGREAVKKYVPYLKQTYKPQLILANGENAAGGRGLTERIYEELRDYGIQGMTLGNHTWAHRDIYDFIESEKYLIRPANYPHSDQVPGRGIMYLTVNQQKLAVINLIGRSFIGNFDDPFMRADELLAEAAAVTPHILIDFHAESTSEKEALSWYVAGRASAVVGTHTHVQTNDARILPGGTGYLTDVGMTGFYDGILGMKKEPIIENFTSQLPTRFEVPRSGRSRLNACFIELDDQGMARKIEPVRLDDDQVLL